MYKLVQTLWGSLVSCGRLLIGLLPRVRPAGGGSQPPRRLTTCPTFRLPDASSCLRLNTDQPSALASAPLRSRGISADSALSGLDFLNAVLRVFLRVSASPRQITFLALFGSLVLAQQQQIPHAGYAYPAGGRQGTTFEITVGGQFLDGVKTAIVSGAGVEATVVEHVKPLTPAQAGELRDQVKELSAKPNPTAEDRKKIVEIQAKIGRASCRER